MKLGVAIDLIYQRINGGRLGTDINVYRIDIKEYLPVAINAVIKENQLLNIRLKRDEEELLPDQYISTFEDVEVKYDEKRDIKYIEFPKTPIIDSGRAIFIMPMQGEEDFNYIVSRTQLKGYDEYIGKKTFFWLEGSKKAFFKNISPLVKKVLLQIVTSIAEMENEDELPIPIGYEQKVLDSCVEWFLGQRFTPNDDLVDNIENANRQQQ